MTAMLGEMLNLEKIHSVIWKKFAAGNFSFQLSTQNTYDRSEVKKAIQRTINRDRGKTFYPLLVTRYFLLATCYFLLVTRYFLLVTRYLSGVTHYSLLVDVDLIIFRLDFQIMTNQ